MLIIKAEYTVCSALNLRKKIKQGRTQMSRKRKDIFIIAAVLCVISLIIMCVTLLFEKHNFQQNTFIPPLFEEKAICGTPSDINRDDWRQFDAQVYKFSICTSITVVGKKADIWLTNPQENLVWIKMRVLDESGNKLGETGLLRPGEYVQAVSFDEVPKDNTNIVLKLMAYEPETYYSTGSVQINTTISVGNVDVTLSED